MDHAQVRRYWNENADLWTRLSQAGYDIYRDHLNTPAFFEMLPDVDDLSGLDVGCGEGYNSRLLARRGARVTAIDISDVFLDHAVRSEAQGSPGVRYALANAVRLPFATAAFDFATGIMSFMDVPEVDLALAEIHRVLKPGGFLQFSITHPCFIDTPHQKKVRDESGRAYAVEVGDYFQTLDGDVVELLFCAVPPEIRRRLPKFRVPRFTKTLSQWLNLVIETGFILEWVEEPRPDDEVVRDHPRLQDAQVVPGFLHVRARKQEQDLRRKREGG
jgi:ubiquinone/menaquinone biosynthesis C-methylase UbiE